MKMAGCLILGIPIEHGNIAYIESHSLQKGI